MKALLLGGTASSDRILQTGCWRKATTYGCSTSTRALPPPCGGGLSLGDFGNRARQRLSTAGGGLPPGLDTVPNTSNATFFESPPTWRDTLFLPMSVSRGVGRIVFISSGGTVYGILGAARFEESPPSPFAVRHHEAGGGEIPGLYRPLHGLEYVILGPSNPYGSGRIRSGPRGPSRFSSGGWPGRNPWISGETAASSGTTCSSRTWWMASTGPPSPGRRPGSSISAAAGGFRSISCCR